MGESKTEPMPITPEPASVKATTVTRRHFTREDIRLLQLRLREVGFDPGPIDGVAGAKTRGAFTRFQAGCSNSTAVIDEWRSWSQSSTSGSADAKIPNPQETRSIQMQLRNAGFNPGPVDGIFGNKTRLLLTQLGTSCPMVSELASMLEYSTAATSNAVRVDTAQGTQNSRGKIQVSRAGPSDSVQQPTVSQPEDSQEEIRILQLQLRDAGFDPGPFDGIMGPKTKSALQQYQTSRKGRPTNLISGFRGHY